MSGVSLNHSVMFDPNSPFRATAPGPEPLQEVAYRQLREGIAAGELRPGAALSEAKLSAASGFGRAAIRTALARLSESGLVRAEARRGWRVAPVTGAELRAVVAARTRIEPALAEIDLSDPVRQELQARCDVARIAWQAGDAATARQAARTVRAELARALENDLLARPMLDLWDRSDRMLALGVAPAPEDHAALLRALGNGDPGAARAAIEAAIDRFRDAAAAILLDRAWIGTAPAPGFDPRSTPAPDRGDASCSDRND